MILDDQQRWLVRAIRADRVPTHALRRITSGAGGVGLRIYREAYAARLEECLADDFPALRAWLGPRRWLRLVDRVTAAPSRDRSLVRYSRRLPAWLARHPAAVPAHHAAVELAQVEWAWCEALHDPLGQPFDPSILAALAPTQWAQLRLPLAPSLRLTPVRHDIGSWRTALLADGLRPRAPRPAPPAWVVVTRGQDGLWLTMIPWMEGRVLGRLQRGDPLGKALQRSGWTADQVATAFANWIGRRWLIATKSGLVRECLTQSGARLS